MQELDAKLAKINTREQHLETNLNSLDKLEAQAEARERESVVNPIDFLMVYVNFQYEIRRSKRFQNARLFTRWFENVRQGKFVIVVVITDQAPNTRHWVVTAYMARKLGQGDIEWQKS